MARKINHPRFGSMSRQTRTVALVGTFLQEWSFLESAINAALENALDMNPVSFLIIRANLQFRDKVFVLKTLLNYTSLSLAKREEYQKTLQKVADFSTKRNMIAHDGFGASKECDGVQFYVYRAKGALKIASTHWSIKDFKREFLAIERYRTKILGICRDLKREDLIDALVKPAATQPSSSTGGLGSFGFLAHLLQGTPSSGPGLANLETYPQSFPNPPPRDEE